MDKQQNRARRNMDRRRKRYIQRRMLSAAVVLLLITGAGLLAAVFASSQKKAGEKEADTVAANADAGVAKDLMEEEIEKDFPTEPDGQDGQENRDIPDDVGGQEEPEEASGQPAGASSILDEANRLADSYDYDNAIEKIKSSPGYEQDAQMTAAIADFEARKAECVPVDIQEVTHIFYHTLVVDPSKAFANQENDPQAVGNNQWMTTIDEFNKITQAMYDEGYVMVDLHDIAEETVDENGVTHFKEGTIMLPPGKKAFVLSIDDLSYYHSYDGYGYASKMVLDENGKPKCEYIQDDGTTVVGDYDVVPLMDKFIEEHPDASYRGAKGTIALTGYNGVLGYRTDITYQTVPADINADKKKWLEEHPDFNLETERAKAKEVADAMKADGWVFASHTWGHMKIGDASMERLRADTEKWKESVEPVVGPTDTIIFAHGQDMAGWPQEYEPGNEKFEYLKGQGFNYFCNVDSNQYRVQIQDNYVRQGRRNLDGYRIYFNAIGEEDSVSDLFDAKQVLDPNRPPVHRLGS